jgi:hypothetical protein
MYYVYIIYMQYACIPIIFFYKQLNDKKVLRIYLHKTIWKIRKIKVVQLQTEKKVIWEWSFFFWKYKKKMKMKYQQWRGKNPPTLSTRFVLAVPMTWISIWRKTFSYIYFLFLLFFYWHRNDYYFCADEISCQCLFIAHSFQITKLLLY